MLGRKTYTRGELDRCKSLTDRRLAVYERFVAATSGETTDSAVQATRGDFEEQFFNDWPWCSIASSCIGSGW